MPFIPHTAEEVRTMLDAIGVDRIETLFDEIPPALRSSVGERVPPALSEMGVSQLARQRAQQQRPLVCFAGGGAYDHHIPAAVWEITTRGEFYSAYTPYQPEASQGTLQTVYEFQSMIAGLTGLDVANASLYDGATALAEAILMAVRANRKSSAKRVLLPAALSPAWRDCVRTLVSAQGIELELLPFEAATGTVDMAALEQAAATPYAALVVVVPNYFGAIEAVDALVDRAHADGALAIAAVNPTALALLRPPGQWGAQGADIACGEGQPLGIPLAGGGPYVGFLACRHDHVRQMPGRIVGRATDADGRPGFVLTLQAREQHIRRSRATSNICTNQGLMATAATLYMAIMGPQGLADVARASHANLLRLRDALTAIDGVEPIFGSAVFHECAVRLPRPAPTVLAALADRGILGGVALGHDYPELGEGALLVCATELRSEDEIAAYATALAAIL